MYRENDLALGGLVPFLGVVLRVRSQLFQVCQIRGNPVGSRLLGCVHFWYPENLTLKNNFKKRIFQTFRRFSKIHNFNSNKIGEIPKEVCFGHKKRKNYNNFEKNGENL